MQLHLVDMKYDNKIFAELFFLNVACDPPREKTSKPIGPNVESYIRT